MLKSVLAWLLILSMIFPNTALTAYAAEAGMGIPADQGTQVQDVVSGNDGEANHSEDTQDENTGSGDEETDVEDSADAEEADVENGEGTADETDAEDGEGTADETDVEDSEDATAESEETADEEKINIDKKADNLTTQNTETVRKGTFTDLDVAIGMYQVTQLYGWYTPSNEGITSEDQLEIVLEQLDSQETVLATKDINFYKSDEQYYFYDYSDVLLNGQTAKIRIKVTETVDGTVTEYVSETFTRRISSKTPVFTMTQNGETGVNSVSYKWSVKDYQPNDTYASENFKLQFIYSKKDSTTSQTKNYNISVYEDNSGTVTLDNLTENTTYTITAKIYIADDAGTEVFTQTITSLPEFTTGTEATYTFATIIPDATLRSEIADRVSGFSSTATTVTRSQLEKVTYLTDTRHKASDAAVKSLKGIEYLTNLESLYLENHELTDISNVNWSSLKKLRTLSLTGNDISKAVDLSGMSGLEFLYLDENMLNAETIASIKAKLPASCTYAYLDDQRTEGVVLLAEPVYYQVDGKSPLFVRIKGIKSRMNDQVISFQLDGNDVSFTKSSYGSMLYYLADSGLAAGETSHTIKATVDGVIKEATFQIVADQAQVETQFLSQEWYSADPSVRLFGTVKTVTDYQMVNAAGVVYGEKRSYSNESPYTNSYDDRYQTVGEGSSLYVGDVYQGMGFFASLVPVWNMTPVGTYNLRLTYADGTKETIEDVFRVVGDKLAYINDIHNFSGYDNMGDYLYVTLLGNRVDCSKLDYKVTDELGNEKAVSYVSVKKQVYGINDAFYIVKLKKSDWKPNDRDRIVVEVTAKTGYEIEILNNKVTCFLYPGVFYVGWNPTTNAMEVAVTQDMEISSVRVELRNNTDNWEDQGDEFLSGETDSISQGFAMVSLRDSEGNIRSVPGGYYYIKVYLNGSGTANYQNRQYLGGYGSASSTVGSHWTGGYYLRQGTSGVKYCYYMLGYDTYKNATFRAELLDSDNKVQTTWSNTSIAKAKNGNYLTLTVADSKDFCDLEPGSYTLRLYYQTAAMEQENWVSYPFKIISKDKFLMFSQYAGWIGDDMIQLGVITVNTEETEKLKVQMYDKDGTELTGISTVVEGTYGNVVYLNVKVKDLTYAKALSGYYFKVTHSAYGMPYQVDDNDREYYTDERGEYENLYYHSMSSKIDADGRLNGFGYRGFKLPITVEAYLPYDTEVQASFTASSRSFYSNGYSFIDFTKSFIDQLPDKNRLYDVVVTDSTGRSYCMDDHVLGYSGTTVKLTGLSVSPSALTLAEGVTGKLSVAAKPATASLPSLSWSSSNTEVATVNASGVVTAVAGGTATITVSGGGYSAKCKVTVQAQVAKPTVCALTETEGTYDPKTGVVTVNKKGTVVKLQSDTTGATIYYTTDGTDPTTKSTKYNATAGIPIIRDTTVKAIAVKRSSVNSAVATFNCKVRRVTVTFNAEGATPETQTQTLYVGEYLDMSKIKEPVYADDYNRYFAHWKNQGSDGEWEKLNVNNAVTDSFTCEAVYDSKENLDAPKANYESDVKLPYGSLITLSVQKARRTYAYEEGESSGEGAVEYAADAVIYYTLDGTDPTTGSEVYSGSIILTKDMVGEENVITLKAMATGTKYVTSSVSTYTYEMMTEDEVKESLGEVQPEDIPSDGVTGIEDKGIWIAGVDENGYTYTGSAIKPSVRVYDGTKLLTEKKDYSISYSNNTNVPKDESAKQPTIKVAGKGNYSETQEVTFRILPKDISDSDLTADDIYVMYTGKVQTKVPVLKWGKKKLTRSNNPRALKDYMVFYEEDQVDGSSFRNPGKYVITLLGTGNYTGMRTVTENILDKNTEYLASKLTVTMTNKKLQYTGEAITAEDIGLVVKSGKTLLTEGTDYELIYRDNVEVGTATVTVKGLHGYVGTKAVTFKITGVPMSKVKLANPITNLEYKAGITEYTQSGCKLTYSYKDAAKESHTDLLAEGTDYTVSYLNNTKVGTAKIVFTGKGKYTGTLAKNFKITQSTEFNSDTVKALYKGTELTSNTTIPYSKGGVKPEITVKIGDTELVNGTDYKVSYKNNSKLYDGSDVRAKAPTLTITGKGNYKGTITKTFKISAQGISALDGKLTAPDVVWKNKKNNYKTKVVITDLDGKVLKENTDYTLTYWQGDKEIVSNTIIDAPTKDAGCTTITVKAVGKGAYEGNKESVIETTFRIAGNDFSKVKLSGKIAEQRYTGKEIELEKKDIVEAGLCMKEGKSLVPLTTDDFTIVGYRNNIKKGTATVILQGNPAKGYAGQKTLTFKITTKSMKNN